MYNDARHKNGCPCRDGRLDRRTDCPTGNTMRDDVFARRLLAEITWTINKPEANRRGVRSFIRSFIHPPFQPPFAGIHLHSLARRVLGMTACIEAPTWGRSVGRTTRGRIWSVCRSPNSCRGLARGRARKRLRTRLTAPLRPKLRSQRTVLQSPCGSAAVVASLTADGLAAFVRRAASNRSRSSCCCSS